MSFFYPDHLFRRVEDIPPEWLGARGISVLLLDVDNTLTTHGNPELTPLVADWIARVKRAGIKLLILSNNNPARVAPFAAKLELSYIANAAKPLPGGIRRARERLGVPEGGVAVVGDQIFTDVLCAKLGGAVSILVEPIEPESFLFFKLKRRLEKIVLRGYHKGEE